MDKNSVLRIFATITKQKAEIKECIIAAKILLNEFTGHECSKIQAFILSREFELKRLNRLLDELADLLPANNFNIINEIHK